MQNEANFITLAESYLAEDSEQDLNVVKKARGIATDLLDCVMNDDTVKDSAIIVVTQDGEVKITYDTFDVLDFDVVASNITEKFQYNLRDGYIHIPIQVTTTIKNILVKHNNNQTSIEASPDRRTLLDHLQLAVERELGRHDSFEILVHEIVHHLDLISSPYKAYDAKVRLQKLKKQKTYNAMYNKYIQIPTELNAHVIQFIHEMMTHIDNQLLIWSNDGVDGVFNLTKLAAVAIDQYIHGRPAKLNEYIKEHFFGSMQRDKRLQSGFNDLFNSNTNPVDVKVKNKMLSRITNGIIEYMTSNEFMIKHPYIKKEISN